MPKGGWTTPEEREQILTFYQTEVDEELPTLRETADHIGRNMTTVRGVVQQAGVYRPEKTFVTTAVMFRVVKLYLTKENNRWLSTVEVGKRVGLDSKTVWSLVDRAGVRRSRSEAHRRTPSEDVCKEIIYWFRVLRSAPKAASRLGISEYFVYEVLRSNDELLPVGPNSVAKVRRTEALCIANLYAQGRSLQEVADLTERSYDVVLKIVHDAGITRSRDEGARMHYLRKRARARLAAMDIEPLARRWMAGDEVEDLAPHDVPPDLLWEAIAERLATLKPDTDATCGSCILGCVVICAHAP